MQEDEHYTNLAKACPRLNRTTLVGRIKSVSAVPARNEILLDFEAITDDSPPFQVAASIPCGNEHMAAETVWYAKLWKKEKLIALEGVFRVVDGILTMIAPDVILTTKKVKTSLSSGCAAS